MGPHCGDATPGRSEARLSRFPFWLLANFLISLGLGFSVHKKRTLIVPTAPSCDDKEKNNSNKPRNAHWPTASAHRRGVALPLWRAGWTESWSLLRCGLGYLAPGRGSTPVDRSRGRGGRVALQSHFSPAPSASISAPDVSESLPAGPSPAAQGSGLKTFSAQ